ncbi:MAG TPA: hypothetical protein VFC04_06160 [Actinomycetota bacterium]|nr:hypothetical protein [Actinomycetota bacterium]
MTSHERSLVGRSLLRAAAIGSLFRKAVREPVVLVLVLAGVVDALSGGPWSHGALLVGVAILLGFDRLRRRRRARALGLADEGEGPGHELEPVRAGGGVAAAHVAPRIRFTPVTVIGGVLYSAVVGSFARFSWPMTLAVAVPGVAAVVAAWNAPARPGPPRIEPAGAVAWATVFIVLGLWELANLLLQPSLTVGSNAHPTISVLTDPMLASHLGRSVFLALWLAFGAFLMER